MPTSIYGTSVYEFFFQNTGLSENGFYPFYPQVHYQTWGRALAIFKHNTCMTQPPLGTKCTNPDHWLMEIPCKNMSWPRFFCGTSAHKE
jgi:hypothetical protein